MFCNIWLADSEDMGVLQHRVEDLEDVGVLQHPVGGLGGCGSFVTFGGDVGS